MPTLHPDDWNERPDWMWLAQFAVPIVALVLCVVVWVLETLFTKGE